MIALVLAATVTTASFGAQFDYPGQRVWTGEDWWANPSLDWQLNEGRLECTKSAANRTMALLTAEIGDGDFSAFLSMGLENSTRRKSDSVIGLEFARKETYGHYKGAAVNGRGVRIGVDSQGFLAVGSRRGTVSLRSSIDDLQLFVIRQGTTLTVTAKGEGVEDSIRLQGEEVPNLNGPIAIASHLPGLTDTEGADAWFDDLFLEGSGVVPHPDRAFGPVLFTQFTINKGDLRMTANFPPFGSFDAEEASLQLQTHQGWKTVDTADIDPDSRTALFDAPAWPTADTSNYRVVWDHINDQGQSVEAHFGGTIKPEPFSRDLVVGALTCFGPLGYPSQEIVDGLTNLDPDILLFSGDQLYEGNAGFGTHFRPPFENQTLDYLRKWQFFGWAFRDLLRDIPSVTIPDDHDVYHGNIWGNGGVETVEQGTNYGAEKQDGGGYKMPVKWVNMVHRTQTGHLPDPPDDSPLPNGINVYYTNLVFGGMDLAVIEDRKWKTAPKTVLPEYDVWNGFPRNQELDPLDSDHPDAQLLGERQEKFLADWAQVWPKNARHKVVLSQTVFSCQQSLPQGSRNDQLNPRLPILERGAYPPDDEPVPDMDSNGWPMAARNRAVELLRRATALHIAGDQHLGTVIQYGLKRHADAFPAFCTPSISNVWPRRWFPSMQPTWQEPGAPRYTGDYIDGFGHPLRVIAAANPYKTGREPWQLYDKATGISVVRLSKTTGEVLMQCYPRWSDPTDPEAEQFPGWPHSYTPLEILKGAAVGSAGSVALENGAVVTVANLDTQSHEYSTWLPAGRYDLPALTKGKHNIFVNSPRD